MDVAVCCYRVAASLPDTEKYGLQSQLRRAGVSIASNIAEGSGRRSDREFVRFLRIAYASACEVETQALLIERLGLGDSPTTTLLIDKVVDTRRMLSGLIARIRSEPSETG